MEQAAESPESLWRIAKWARTRQNQAPTVTPALKDPVTSQVAVTPEEKAKLFKETFFPAPPDTNLKDTENAIHSNQTTPPITEQEVDEAIREAAPFKAPGPDGITNRALQIASLWVYTHLVRIFKACHSGTARNTSEAPPQ